MEDYRNIFYLLLLVLAIAVTIKTRKLIYLLFILPVVLAFKNHYNHGPIADTAWAVPTILSICYCTYKILVTSGINKQQKHFITLHLILLPVFFVFTALNVCVIERYLFIAIIPVLFISAVLLVQFINILNKHLFIPVLLVIASIQAYAYTQDQGHSDMKMGAFDAMYVEQKMVSFAEEHNFYDRNIASHSFLIRTHFQDKNSGFLSGRDTFSNVYYEYNWGPDIIVVDNIEPDDLYEQVKTDTFFRLIYRVEKGTAWSEMYGRKQTIHIK